MSDKEFNDYISQVEAQYRPTRIADATNAREVIGGALDQFADAAGDIANNAVNNAILSERELRDKWVNYEKNRAEDYWKRIEAKNEEIFGLMDELAESRQKESGDIGMFFVFLGISLVVCFGIGLPLIHAITGGH